MKRGTKEEIGRELKADELRPGTIVFTNPEHRPHVFLTMWVDIVSDAMVWFYAGVTKVHLGLFRHPDGTLRDDAGREIRIFEYLGEP